MIDVNPTHLETVTRILAAHVPECEVRAFGSRVTWTAKDYSDLDLAVVCDRALDPDVLRRMREAFETSDLPFRVDVLDWHAISVAFQKVIEKKYEVVQKGGKKSFGGVNDEWVTVRLGDVTDLLTGFPFESNRYVNDDSAPRLLRGDNVAQGALRWDGAKRWPIDSVEDVGNYLLCEGDVILAMDRPWIEAGLKYASVRGSDLPSLLVQRVARLRGTNCLDTRFLKYVVGSQAFTEHVLAVVTGTAVPHISGGDIKNFKFQLPPLPSQRAIALILGTLDDKIELNRRMNETLEAMARALFKSWFVDFDPVRAKAAGRDSGLPQPLADIFPNSFEDSELGKIPKGWSVGPVLNTARLLSGGTPKTDRPEYWGGDIRWASAKDVSQCADAFLVATERMITQRGLEESATQLVPAFSSAVVARGATTGRMALFGDAMTMNQTCYALESISGAPFALYCQLRQEIDKLVHGAHGSVFDTITTSTFATSTVVLPAKAILLAFEDRVGPLFHSILTGTRESRALAALRDTLLPRLISGELRVEDAEGFVGEANA